MARRYATEQPAEAAARTCDHTGCREAGEHRAPKSRDTLEDYYWFCVKHVREYNRAWNFFKGMSKDEIEDYQHSRNTWHRPTWNMGVNGSNGARVVYTINGIGDDLGPFAATKPLFAHTEPHKARVRFVAAPIRKALATLELAPMASVDEVKTRYKELAKEFHPDLNGGSTDDLERLKDINLAYSYLSAVGHA